MNLFILSSIFALTSAAQLPARSYLPQHLGGVPGQPGYQTIQGTPAFGVSGDTGNRRPQQEAEKNAVTLKQDQAINEDGSYHFGYETSNGIRAEEAGNTVQAQGGFSYQGDDGHTYTIVYTAGEGGFRPQGEHLPVAPPTPQAILDALKKNEQDEAAGIFDDGKYHPEKHGGGHGGAGSSGSRGYLPPAAPGHQGGYRY